MANEILLYISETSVDYAHKSDFLLYHANTYLYHLFINIIKLYTKTSE